MPSLFNRISGTGSATLFEIRLDNDVIILRGGEDDASSQLLKGAVVLCLPAALKVEDVHLRMTGHLKVGWTDQRVTPTGLSNHKVDRTSEIFCHKWAPFVSGSGLGSSSKGIILPAGNYEWPFELVVPGSTAESVEGLTDTNITYKLKATVARGKLAYDLHAWKPVRIVRTLDPSALELAHTMTVENVWPNKIEYQIIIPSKAVIFGTAINVEMRFTSLLKGLKIGLIKCQLIESQEFSIAGAGPNTQRIWRHTRDIESWNFELNEDEHYQDILNDSGQDGYTLSENMPLPKRLQRCLQDVDVHGIKIRHKVKFNVALHNPDGHVSELRATLPVHIFISPNMPLSSDGSLVDQTPLSTQSVDVGHHAPPLYGEHILDQLYADMDQSGMMTPAPQSGMNTPFYSMSRSGSQENLATAGDDAHPSGAVPPAALSSRLQNLNTSSRHSGSLHTASGTDSGADTEMNSYFDRGSHSGNTSNPLSRRVSEEEHHIVSNTTSGYHTPEHIDYSDLGDLSKVPSYTTAIKAPIRGMSYNDALPNYDTAISTPSSPARSAPNTPGAGVSHLGASAPRLNPLSHMGFTPIHPSTPVYTGHDGDERRRLHLLQHRERSH